MKFSEVVKEAKDKGFTEPGTFPKPCLSLDAKSWRLRPDPRDDLGGTDVQRKAVESLRGGGRVAPGRSRGLLPQVTILAREIGLKIELDDVPALASPRVVARLFAAQSRAGEVSGPGEASEAFSSGV